MPWRPYPALYLYLNLTLTQPLHRTAYSDPLFRFCIPYFIFHCFLLSPVVPSALLLCWIREQDHPTCVASNQAANQHVPPAFSFVTVMLHDLLCRSTYPHVSFLGRALLPVLHLRSCNVARFDLAGYSPPLLQPLFTSTALAQAPSRPPYTLRFIDWGEVNAVAPAPCPLLVASANPDSVWIQRPPSSQWIGVLRWTQLATFIQLAR
eukprot:g82363.t1